MTKFRLNRRTVLKGAGTIAIALPWMEAMEKRGYAQTATTIPAKRFISVYQPGGTVRIGGSGPGGDSYTISGTETAPVFTTSKILAPLDPVKDKMIIVDGLNINAGVGEQHQRGIITWMTGSVQVGVSGSYGYSKDGPSIDQILVPTLSKGKKIQNLVMAVRWGTGKAHGLMSPISCANFATGSPYSPVPPRLDPQVIFSDVFGSLTTTPGTTTTPDASAVALNRKKSILDFVDKKYVSLGAKLGAADKAKLDQHLTKLREVEASIMVAGPVTTATCKQPTKVDTSDYDPKAGLASANDGTGKDLSSDPAIPKVGKFMMDMLVMAMACDLTGVAHMQWTDTEAKHTFPWLSLSQHHHFYQHDGGFNPSACEKICNWYSTQHLYLLQQLQAVDMGGHSLLDESVVFCGTEIGHPPTHSKTNLPYWLAGKGGGMRPGRWLKFNGTSHNGLLLGILNLFGDNRTSIGSSAYQSASISLK